MASKANGFSDGHSVIPATAGIELECWRVTTTRKQRGRHSE